jgi:hypothetical protein
VGVHFAGMISSSKACAEIGLLCCLVLFRDFAPYVIASALQGCHMQLLFVALLSGVV